MSSNLKALFVKSTLSLSILLQVFGAQAAPGEKPMTNLEQKTFELRPRHVYFFGTDGKPSEFAKKAGDRLCEMRGFKRATDWTDARMAQADIDNPQKLTGFQTFQKDGKAFVKLTSFEEIMKDAKPSDNRIAVLFKSVTCEREKTKSAAVEDSLFQEDPADIDQQDIRSRLSDSSIEEL
ncbi:MAG: hypothetical protein KF767_05040 [Bdellovibrionaceae bacterium]|nr:hypothetical protein [Pseudobdellovibrionaceae bacterium]